MKRIRISIERQTLEACENDRVVRCYTVSTALKGVGEQKGSEQTPRGAHLVRAKIGDGQPLNTVFRGRRPTGEVWSADLSASQPGRDWILTRILWLSGLESGRNRLGAVDTMQRYIYIHGTPDSEPMGVPRSHGCIRMRGEDLVELFDWTPVGCPVDITEGP